MNEQLRFDRYRFEPHTARLWAGNREIRLTPKAAAVLRLLLGRAGEPVTKRELFASVWSNRVVSDDALTTCIQELRRALGDDAKRPRYIETRHRSGYRFVEPLSHAVEPAVTTPEAAIAVLPFADLSPARDQDYFCEGLAEELIDALAAVDGLRVAARSASSQLGGAGLDLREAALRLGVGSVLSGSVRREGDRLRITVQLVDVASGYHKWSQRFERGVGEVFAIQDEIAETVATLLRGGALSRREKNILRRPQTAAEAYEWFLRGRQYLHRLRRSDLDRSREMFQRAIALDERYAPAWSGLATVHALLYEWWGAREEDLEQTDRTSRIAMEVDPDSACSNIARGYGLSLLSRYAEARQHFEAAMQINPNLFEAYYYYGRECFARGDIERSADLFRRAADIRREDFQSVLLLAQALRMLGRGDEARAATREGLVRAERTLDLNPAHARALSLGSVALYHEGETQRAIEWSRRALELYPDDMAVLINAACLKASVGVKAEALDILERVFARGWGKRAWIDQDPDYDILRDDPRFQQLLEKLK